MSMPKTMERQVREPMSLNQLRKFFADSIWIHWRSVWIGENVSAVVPQSAVLELLLNCGVVGAGVSVGVTSLTITTGIAVA